MTSRQQVWSAADATPDWAFHPTGDGRTCVPWPPRDHALLQNIHILCPIFHRGYVYGYTVKKKDATGVPVSVFVRTPVARFEAVVAACDVSETLRHECGFLGMPRSQAADLLGTFIFDLEHVCARAPRQGAWDMLDPKGRLGEVRRALKRLKPTTLPAGLTDLLDRLAALYPTLVHDDDTGAAV